MRSAIPLSLLVIFVAFPVVLIAGPLTDKGTQPGLSYPMLAPSDCAGCHGNYDSSNNLEPWNTWAGSMMAQAGRDPLFWAALDVANNDIPGAGDFCLRCHAPSAWLAGRSEPPGGSVDGCGLEGKLDETGKDFDGLTCHTCHRMMINPSPPAGQDTLYFENGQFWIDDSDCGGAGEPCRRGPYDYPADGSDPPPHAWAFSSYMESSKMCGNCHNVTSPVKTLIEGGVDTGIPYPIERTYKEWLQSDFGDPQSVDFKTCQNCHMPDATANPAYACDSQINNHTGDLPIHQLAGGNAWVPDVLRQEYPNLNLSQELIATRDWALDMLQNQSALVEVTAPDSLPDGDTLSVDVKVTNLTGHKLPTGYPEGRRMWLHLEVRDGLNNLVYESGAYNAGTGVLTKDAQIKVYESKPGIYDYNGTGDCDAVDGSGNAMFHFVLNDCYVVDNRIPPRGFTGGTDPEMSPKNYTYPETFPGSGILVDYDITTYSVPIPPGTPTPLTATGTLRYQTVSKEYVDFLLDQSTTHGFPPDCIERSSGFSTQTRAEILNDMWTTYGRSAPVDMDADSGTTTIVLSPLAIAPTDTTVIEGNSVAFQASGGSTPYAFSLLANHSGGSINPGTGLYTAGLVTDVVDTVLVIDAAVDSVQARIQVVSILSITPATASLNTGNSQTFSGVGGLPPYVFVLAANHSGGTIDPGTGLYVAGSTGGVTDTVQVSDDLGQTAQAFVTVPEPVGIGDNDPVHFTRLLPGAPNPFGSTIMLSFALQDPGPVRLSVYGIDGSLIRSVLNEHRPAGLHQVRWDGRNELGRIVASGIYLVRFESREFRQSRRIIRLQH